MFSKKILIIDDSEMMVRLTRDILIEQQYQVVTACNGVEGLKLVASEKPDLVLLDVVMPLMDGFEVCRLLREDESNNLMPIIMLTAQENEDDRLTGLELGADDYITKPFNPRELVSRVRNTLLRIDRNRRANPLTGLQGNVEIQSEINHRIAKNQKFAVIYLDADHFKAFNDVYGFVQGDRAIKVIADAITDMVHVHGSGSDFIGHIGGDDFVVITKPSQVDELCRSIIASFEERILELYSEQDRSAGYIMTKDRTGELTRFPVMTVSIAVVTNEQRELTSHLQVGEIAAELKKKAKSINGSVYLKDARQH